MGKIYKYQIYQQKSYIIKGGSLYMPLNVHVLSDATSMFCMYPQTEGNKGSDEVCTFVHQFLYNYLKKNVKQLNISADYSAGQQKKFSFIRFLYNLVNVEKKLTSVKMTFPIRGHS